MMRGADLQSRQRCLTLAHGGGRTAAALVQAKLVAGLDIVEPGRLRLVDRGTFKCKPKGLGQGGSMPQCVSTRVFHSPRSAAAGAFMGRQEPEGSWITIAMDSEEPEEPPRSFSAPEAPESKRGAGYAHVFKVKWKTLSEFWFFATADF